MKDNKDKSTLELPGLNILPPAVAETRKSTRKAGHGKMAKQEQLNLLADFGMTDTSGLPAWINDENTDINGLPIWR
ncbi:MULTISPECIES: hypothetical protein [unclassified Undibacterium]|uniref:hypothetical protein n=1 Tax=unclassified Undibacterium TaxID=2630295 RepID=UPI002AC996CC|nr:MULTISPECIES: hypothetical protein [unclassified Undibacterium]MEB0139528.1 hypothetical protein [Undibacterium sp. CCC2.1]MEB0172363.1 hypothetical protein [Undibacterium sp. CCC1.1]MEB0175690.1 hypothetical protein [Undibacterium sp. CCC3.4]MEB0214478.1 hypothetical protein [Undibacterium sp. 5I2]WPX42875.1 hypothetical protein RHM61_16030 [Undibacterium sp. CCC3.4]